MSKRAAGQTSAGNVVNLLSNDVSRLDYGFIYVHFIWILPFQSKFKFFNLTMYQSFKRLLILNIILIRCLNMLLNLA